MTSPYQKRVEPPPSTPRMGPDSVAQLVIYLLRQPAVGASAAAILAPEHFTLEPHYRAVWSSLLDLRKKYTTGAAPFDALYLAVAEAAAQPNSRMTDEQRVMLLATPDDVGKAVTAEPDGPIIERPGILWHAYNVEDASKLDPQFGLDLLKRFLHERVVIDRAAQLTAGASERVPGNFESVLAAVRADLLKISSLGKSVEYRMDEFPDDPEPIEIFTTGVGYLDELMAGGQVNGETYMLFGPYKGGKTFLAGEIANGTADSFRLLKQAGGPDKQVAYFSYELLGVEMARRFRANGADVKLDRLEHEIKARDDYSVRGKLLPYEVEYYKRKGLFDMSKLPGELERIRQYHATIGKHLKLYDMLSVEAGAGGGGVEEVVALIDQMIMAGQTPGMVVIDNIFFAAHRTVDCKGWDWESKGRGEISSWVTKSITHIARKFNVPVWLLHQYNADANSMKPGKRLTATQGAESRTLAAHANMLFCLGARDEGTNVAQFVLDRTRRGKNGGMRKLIQLEGDLARWHDVSDGFEIVSSGEDEGRIIQKVKASIDAIDPSAAAKLAKPVASPDPYKAEKKQPAPIMEVF